jgi:hypothetical protein
MTTSLPLSGQVVLVAGATRGARRGIARAEAATPVGLGLRALKGGAVVVGVTVEGGEPRVVLSTFLATCAEGDRLSFEPYSVAAEFKRDP